MTKNGHQKFRGRKSNNFEGKGEILKIFPSNLKIFPEIGENPKQEVNASLPQRGWTPLERGDLGQEITFIDKIRKRRLTWFGHVRAVRRPRRAAAADNL